MMDISLACPLIMKVITCKEHIAGEKIKSTFVQHIEAFFNFFSTLIDDRRFTKVVEHESQHDIYHGKD